MNMNDYIEWTRSTAVYPGAGDQGLQEVMYLTLGLASESGEVAGKLKKYLRGDEFLVKGFIAELGDVLWYLARLCDNLNITLEDLAEFNYTKIEERKSSGTIQGTGDTIAERIGATNDCS